MAKCRICGRRERVVRCNGCGKAFCPEHMEFKLSESFEKGLFRKRKEELSISFCSIECAKRWREFWVSEKLPRDSMGDHVLKMIEMVEATRKFEEKDPYGYAIFEFFTVKTIVEGKKLERLPSKDNICPFIQIRNLWLLKKYEHKPFAGGLLKIMEGWKSLNYTQVMDGVCICRNDEHLFAVHSEQLDILVSKIIDDIRNYGKLPANHQATLSIQPPTQQPIPLVEPLPFCPQCGGKLQPDWKVCGYCGRKLTGE